MEQKQQKNVKGQFVKGNTFGFKKGQKAWNKGKKCSYLKGNTNGFKKGMIPWNKGKHWSEEVKIKLVESHKGKKPSLKIRKKMSESHKGMKKPWVSKAQKGEKSHFWKGGISKKREYKGFIVRQRRTRKKGNGGIHTLGEWETLKAQCNWTCLACKKREPEIKLTEDHIIPISKGGSNNIENIQPLCRSCNNKKYTKIIKY